MPVTKSAKKALRRDQSREKINLRIKKRVKTAISLTRHQPTKKNLSLAFRQLDRAAKHNLFHKNKAARLKSRLTKLILGKKAKK